MSPDTNAHHPLQPAAPAAQLLDPAHDEHMLNTEKQGSLHIVFVLVAGVARQ